MAPGCWRPSNSRKALVLRCVRYLAFLSCRVEAVTLTQACRLTSLIVVCPGYYSDHTKLILYYCVHIIMSIT